MNMNEPTKHIHPEVEATLVLNGVNYFVVANVSEETDESPQCRFASSPLVYPEDENNEDGFALEPLSGHSLDTWVALHEVHVAPHLVQVWCDAQG